MTVTRPPIVVGVDGSPGADLALTWALDEGRSCALPVRLVYAYGWAMTGGDIAIYGNLPNPELLRVRSAANELLEKAASRARQAAPDVEISTHRIGDDAVRVLIAESARASMIVVGTGHRRVLGSLLAGSVEAAVSALASCPIVVVRDVVATPAGPGAVVVGIDGGDESHAVLDFAFEYASRRSASLHAVVCWHPDFLTAMVQRPDPSAQHDARA